VSTGAKEHIKLLGMVWGVTTILLLIPELIFSIFASRHVQYDPALYSRAFWVVLAAVYLCVTIITIFRSRLYEPQIILPVLGIFSFLLFYSYSVVIMWDSAHYLSFIAIIDGDNPMNHWDVLRGPTFPVFLWATTKILGTTGDAMLLVHYVIYALTLFLYYLFANAILPLNTTNKKLTAAISIYVIIGLNPLIFGYYHVLLTEYLASFFTAALIYSAVMYYKTLNLEKVDKTYRLSQLTLIITCFLIFHLKQNYLMLAIGALFAVIILTLVRRSGKRAILRSLRLLAYTVTTLFISIFIWNAILPDISNSEYMQSRTSERMFVGLFTPSTDFVDYYSVSSFTEKHPEQTFISSDGSLDMVVAFYDLDRNLLDAYGIKGFSNRIEFSLTDAISVSIKNFFRHPILITRGITDSYLAGINFYSSDTINWKVIRELNIPRANENGIVGYAPLHTHISNVHHMKAELYNYAAAFERTPTVHPEITGFFYRVTPLSNISFTFGFLLLPFVWVGTLVFSIIRKKEVIFSIAFICATISFGYVLFNSVTQMFIDRYNFPGYIPAWIAISCFAYGLLGIYLEKKKAKEKKHAENSLES